MHLSGSRTSSAPSCRPPATCTIIARNYLAQARTLAESYAKHEPDGRFYLLVLDGLPDGVDPGANVQVISPQEIGMRKFVEMSFKYDARELSTAVKPNFLATLLDRYEEEIIYFDPDILILKPLDELKEILPLADIVLIPHLLKPIPLDGYRPRDQDILISGAYNLGFIALRKSDQTRQFLRWWDERLRDGCVADPCQGLMTDQKWMDLTPGLFPGARIFRDETYDVAYWNIPSRTIEKAGSPAHEGAQFLVNGEPLTFFHFSGFDPLYRKVLSKYDSRTVVKKGSALADLLNLYADLLMENGYAITSTWRYGFDRFGNGMLISPLLRRLYLDLDKRTRKYFGNPFDTSGRNSFLDWATTTEHGQRGLSPFLRRVYRPRLDLRAAFPDIAGPDRAAFLDWARTKGAAEMGFDPAMVRDDSSQPPLADVADGVAGAAEVRVNGVNVTGYFRHESGVGEVARGFVRALDDLGIPVALHDLTHHVGYGLGDSSLTLTDFDTKPRYDVNLICVNADQQFRVVQDLGEEHLLNHYNIGVWHWELPTFPAEWHDRFAYFDEIWVGSSFVANALAPISPIPVIRMPPVIAPLAFGVRARGRQKLGVADGEFVFLFIFNFLSYFERKNPLAAIDAFTRAFSPDDPVRLVIKCVNEDFSPDDFAGMEAMAKKHRISIHTGYWTPDEMRDLMAACDAYVSLHRSEGIGLPMADAMAMGKPVIGTAWSGNTDFMNVSNSFPVSYRLVKLERDFGPYQAGETWAEPSVEHAAEQMRRVVEDRDEASARGVAAKTEIETNYSRARVAWLMHERLAVIGGDQRSLRPAARGADGLSGPIVLYVVGGTGFDGNPAVRDFPLTNRQKSESTAAHLARVERLVATAMAAGGTHLLVPREQADWLGDHPLMAEYFAKQHELVEASAKLGIVFKLSPARL